MLDKLISCFTTRLHRSGTRVAKNWNNLPGDVLTKIAYDLGIRDLVCFRTVCKDWQAASFPCFAEIESSGKPWLLVSQGSNSRYVLYNPLEKATYNISIPEMEGTRCLSSGEGWLLLSRQNQLFFFCPFTRAKVELPEFPHADLADHLALFTGSPTSQQCVVTVAYNRNEGELELHVIQRGENKWNISVRKHSKSIPTALAAAFIEGKSEYIFLSVKDGSIVSSSRKSISTRISQSNVASYTNASNTNALHICMDSCTYMDQQALAFLNIEENAEIIPTLGPIVKENKKYLYCRRISTKKTSEESQKVIYIHPRLQQIPASQGWSG